MVLICTVSDKILRDWRQLDPPVQGAAFFRRIGRYRSRKTVSLGGKPLFGDAMVDKIFHDRISSFYR